MKRVRYPQLTDAKNLISVWSDLIRSLTLQNSYLPTVVDIIGSVTPVSVAVYNILPSDGVLVCDTASNSVTLKLPTALFGFERQITAKYFTGGNNVIIQPSAGETVDGLDPYTLVAVGQVTLRSDGVSKWYVVAS